MNDFLEIGVEGWRWEDIFDLFMMLGGGFILVV